MNKHPLQLALKHKAPEAVSLALIAAFPNAARFMPVSREQDYYPRLHAVNLAVANHASDATVRALVAINPGTLKEKTPQSAGPLGWAGATRGGTVLHLLAASKCSTVAECRNTNAVCFTLVEKGARLAEINADGQTPAERAAAGRRGTRYVWEADNDHLIATFKELALYKQPRHHHLSVIPHFQHWSTVTHAWCTPSAKLTALIVLLVGDTYKRGLLPRLPMDCWYRILGMIPRHELRQGNCEQGAEDAALAKYMAILADETPQTDAYGTPQEGCTPSQGTPQDNSWLTLGIYVRGKSGGITGVVIYVGGDTCTVRQEHGDEVSLPMYDLEPIRPDTKLEVVKVLDKD